MCEPLEAFYENSIGTRFKRIKFDIYQLKMDLDRIDFIIDETLKVLESEGRV